MNTAPVLYSRLPELFDVWSLRFERLGGCYILFSQEQLLKTGKYFVTMSGNTGTQIVTTTSEMRGYHQIYSDTLWHFSRPLHEDDVEWRTFGSPVLHWQGNDSYNSDDSYSEPEELACLPSPIDYQAQLTYLLSIGEGVHNDIELCIQILELIRRMLDN